MPNFNLFSKLVSINLSRGEKDWGRKTDRQRGGERKTDKERRRMKERG
jgi:hypothetical protein